MRVLGDWCVPHVLSDMCTIPGLWGWGGVVPPRVYISLLPQVSVSYHTPHWHPSQRETLYQCWFSVGPPSTTSGQHWTNIGSMSRVCWHGTHLWRHTAVTAYSGNDVSQQGIYSEPEQQFSSHTCVILFSMLKLLHQHNYYYVAFAATP